MEMASKGEKHVCWIKIKLSTIVTALTYQFDVFLSLLGITFELLVATGLVLRRPHAEVVNHLHNRPNYIKKHEDF